jgi:hypothetical protein
MKRFAFAIATAALLATPLAAQTQTSTVNLAGEVMKACVLGDPDIAQMKLGDLTDATGKLDASLVSAAISASASIPVAWCNAPSVITINAVTV